MSGAMLHRGQTEIMFVVFAGSYALAALCWFGVDVTRPIGDSPDPAIRRAAGPDPGSVVGNCASARIVLESRAFDEFCSTRKSVSILGSAGATRPIQWYGSILKP